MPTFTTMFISMPIPAYVCIPSTRLEPVCLIAGGPRPIHLNVPLQPDLRQFLHVHTCLHMFTHAYLTKMFISMPIPFYVCIPSTLLEPVPTSWRSTTHSPECAIATNLTTFAACSHMPILTKMRISMHIPAYACIPAPGLNRCDY